MSRYFRYAMARINSHARTGAMIESMRASENDRIAHPACGTGNFLPDIYVTPPHVVEKVDDGSSKTCWNCFHWEMDEKKPSRGYCPVFDKMTGQGHGEQCTAFEK